MTISSTPSLANLQSEFGVASLLACNGQSLNGCDTSGAGDVAAPISLFAWAGYNHAATPAAPSVSSQPGSPTNTNQDSIIRLTFNLVTCAENGQDIYRATTSGGSYSKIEDDYPTLQYDDPFSPNTSRFYKLKSQGSVNESGFSSEVEGRTAPHLPGDGTLSVSPGPSCEPLIITVSWSNGTSPGVRSSTVTWKWKKNTGSWSSWQGPTSQGATQFVYNAGNAVQGDDFYFEAYYTEEGTSATSSGQKINVICPF